MGRFIPIDKMKKLREAARNGDERAKKIISMQLGGTDDFSADLDDYFKPQAAVPQDGSTQASGIQQSTAVPTGMGHRDSNQNLLKFLNENGVQEGSADYQGYVDDFYREFPNEKPVMGGQNCPNQSCSLFDGLIQDEMASIGKYQQAILELMKDSSIESASRKGMITDLEEIKRIKMDNVDKLQRLQSSKEKKEEANIVPQM